jgi:hypothetical protein
MRRNLLITLLFPLDSSGVRPACISSRKQPPLFAARPKSLTWWYPFEPFALATREYSGFDCATVTLYSFGRLEPEFGT